MYHRVRRKMRFSISAIVLLTSLQISIQKSIETTETSNPSDDSFDNNIIDFDDEYSVKFDKKYGSSHKGQNFNKDSHRYTVVKEDFESVFRQKYHDKKNGTNFNIIKSLPNTSDRDKTSTTDSGIIPMELMSTTDNPLQSIIESTFEPDLTVIPLTTTVKSLVTVEINQTITLPKTSESYETSTLEPFIPNEITTSENYEANSSTEIYYTTTDKSDELYTERLFDTTTTRASKIYLSNSSTTTEKTTPLSSKLKTQNQQSSNNTQNITYFNDSEEITTDESSEDKVPVFTELDLEDESEVPEDYYDSKDVLPTRPPNTDALTVLFGLAGSVVESVVESVAERVIPKGVMDIFKRMQRQNEALEAERLRSREENGGLGQLGRGILKSISTGLGKPLSQLLSGARDNGSLDSDRSFVGGLASGVTNVANMANSVVESFKDRVQAIYPGTVWCGDGRSAAARSSDLGLFFFTDTCCRQHDACKIYIKAGETKYGLTNTGLFTRSHCSCDTKFRECLRKTNSLVSSQIGWTYFNVLGPQCFRKAHPIVKCLRRTRITGQKCEEYELDYTKPKMWQWFDSETF